MSSKNTSARATGAMPVYPAHGHQLASKKHEGTGKNTLASNLTADALSSLAEPVKTQMQEWLEKPQEHEQLAVGHDTFRAAPKIDEFFKDVEENVRDNTQ